MDSVIILRMAVPPDPSVPYSERTILGLLALGIFLIFFGYSIITTQKDVPILAAVTILVLGVACIMYSFRLILLVRKIGIF
jgi:hypothetical protein